MITKIGQLFITGYKGDEPSQEYLEFYQEENIGGVVLFEENCTPHSAAEKAIRLLYGISQKAPFIAVDQEGGRVCRFRGAPVEYAAASEYGKNNDLALFEEQFARAAYYLVSLGVNVLLGPVADLDLNHDNKVLKGRTFGKSPAQVSRFIESAVKIIRKTGMLSCLKHFPGLGAAHFDPHEKLSEASYDYQTFINREGIAFKAGIDTGADMVMTTHLLLPNIDKVPATQSEVVVRQILRGKLGFDGIVITDDLLMGGAGNPDNIGETALAAINAGHDILLIGQDWKACRKAVHYLRKALESGQLEEEKIKRSLGRISGIKSIIAMPVF